MTASDFVKLCTSTTAKPRAKKINAGLVETGKKKSSGPIELNHGMHMKGKRGCVTGADSYGPYAGSGESGCDCGCSGDGSACACGESISPKTFVACLESLSNEYPESPVVSQIMNMFKAMQSGGSGKLYSAADGCESCDQEDDCRCTSDADAAISAAAATCAAALETFRAVSGYDYFDYNNRKG